MVRRKHVINLGLLALAALCVPAFQNCAELRPTSGAVLLQSYAEVRDRQDTAFIKELVGTSVMKAWISASSSDVTASAAADTIDSVDGYGSTLQAAAAGKGPSIVAGASLPGSVFEFVGAKGLKSGGSDLNFLNDAYSFIAILEAPVSGRVISINGDGFSKEEVAIVIQDSKIRAIRETSPGNSAFKEVALASASAPVVVAASFPKSADTIHLQVNGVTVGGDLTKMGIPLENSYIARQVIVGNADGSPNFRLAEMMIFDKELSPAQLNTMSRYIAKRWKFEGVVYDPNAAGGGGPTVEPVDPVFLQVKSILQTRCYDCHSGWSIGSVNGLVASGILVKGNAVGSSMYNRLIGSEGGGTKNMPASGGALTADQVTMIKNWINGL